MAPRKKPSPADTRTLLLACARKCCLCFGLNGDFQVKQGQIAHIDHNPENSSLDNLAFLCLPHHNEYDTVPSQTKRIMPAELLEYKSALEQAVSRVRSQAAIGPSSSPTHAPPHYQFRDRDVKSLERLMNTIHTDLLDDFFENGIHGTFLTDVSVSYDQFQIIVHSTGFHLYNNDLLDSTLRFSDAWAGCFSYENYLFPALTIPDAIQFQSPHMVDNPEEVIEAYRDFQSAMLRAAEAFHRFIDHVKHAYPEVDLTETNRAAFRMLKSSPFTDEEDA